MAAAKPIAVTPAQRAKLERLEALLKAQQYQAVIKEAQPLALEIPGLPFIPNVTGIAWAQLGDQEKAVTCFKRGLTLNPDFPPGLVNLSTSLRLLGQIHPALDAARRAVKLVPDDLQAQCNLASILYAAYKPDMALKTLSKVLKKNNKTAIAHDLVCEIHEGTNQLDELGRAVKSAASALGKSAPIIRYWAAVHAMRGLDYQSAVDQFDTLTANDLPPVKRPKLFEFRGKCLDKLDRSADAFAAFEQANAAVLRSPAARAAANVFLDDLQQRTEDMEQATKPTWSPSTKGTSSPAPTFLVGFPRSGTTLLDTILRGHSQISVVEEQPTVERVVDALPAGETLDDISTLSEDTSEKLRDIYFQELAAHQDPLADGRVIIDKMPLNLIHVALIHRLFPQAKFILALRHPMDCVLSCFMQSFQSNPPMDNFLKLDTTARLYDLSMRYWVSASSLLGIQSATVRYEDVVSDSAAATRPVFRHLGLEWEEDVLDHVSTARSRSKIATPSRTQVTQPLYTSARGRWQTYQSQLEPAAPLLAPWIKHWGYEDPA